MAETVRTVRGRRRLEEAQEERPALADVTALVLLGLGTLMFLALYSYTPGDLPSWVSFSTRAVPNDPVVNIIGPFGAVAAGYLIFMHGAAAFLVPACLIWMGLARALMNLTLFPRPFAGMVLVVGSASVFLGIQTVVFTDWQAEYNILGAGGGIGHVGERIALSTIGPVGALILAVVGYAAGLLLLFGLRLGRVVDMVISWRDQIRDLISNRGRSREPEEAARRKEEAELLREQRRANRERRRIESELSRIREDTDGEAPEAAPAPESLFDFRTPGPEQPVPPPTPEPKIIDGSARRTPAGDRRMSLAEWRRQQQKPKSDGVGQGGLVTGDFADYELPPLDLLHWDEDSGHQPADVASLRATQNNIIHTLSTFGIMVTPGDITRGPTITRYEIYPSEGLRVNRIAMLEADIARATRAERINILAPIPGKDTVGIEIANSDKVAVPLRELLEDPAFQQGRARLPLALGKDVYGETIVADLAGMPHLLVAGATGSGKSVCINSIIASLLFQFTPDQLRFIMIDPKVVEMQTYNDLPHLVVPVVTDAKKVIMALRWVVNEMERRYQMFAAEGVRNFEAFNNRKSREKTPASTKARNGRNPRKSREDGTPLLPMFDSAGNEVADAGTAETSDGEAAMAAVADGGEDAAGDPVLTTHRVSLDSSPDGDVWDDSELVATEEAEKTVPDTIPYIVVIIDELADLMQTAPADMEGLIARIAQKARAAGIHMILATQTPRAEVITGVIKANIPCRIAFQVSSALDSRVILDTKGAEKLVGKGDMLYLPPGTSRMVRAQGAFVTDDEIHALVKHCQEQGGGPRIERSVEEAINGFTGEVEEISEEDSETLERCIEVVMQERKASTSLLQRRLRLGYGRAARMIDLMEQRGIIGPGDGAKPREILIDLDGADD